MSHRGDWPVGRQSRRKRTGVVKQLPRAVGGVDVIDDREDGEPIGEDDI
jgi:hypothetical protein